MVLKQAKMGLRGGVAAGEVCRRGGGLSGMDLTPLNGLSNISLNYTRV